MTLKTFIISSLITFGLSFAIGYWFLTQKGKDGGAPAPQKGSAIPVTTTWG